MHPPILQPATVPPRRICLRSRYTSHNAAVVMLLSHVLSQHKRKGKLNTKQHDNTSATNPIR